MRRREDLLGERFAGLRHNGAVHLHHIDMGATASKLRWDQIACHRGAWQQNPLACQVFIGKRRQQTLRNVLLRSYIHLQVQLFDSPSSGRSDGAYAGAQAAQVEYRLVEKLEEV